MDDASPRETRDADRARVLRRIKLAATLVLVATASLFVVARHFEPMHWAWGYVASFAAAATVGGLADWYAVVALFRRPLGLPIPHTAIIPRNHQRIADNLGTFVETNFLAPEAVDKKLGEVDFAALMADWLSDRDRSAALADFVLKLLPQTLTAIDQSGLRSFIGERVKVELERIELAPLAAGLLTAITEKGRHQRLLNELLGALEKLLTNQEALDAMREKIRKELPALFNAFRSDAYLLRKIVASATAFIEEARGDPEHPLRREFDGFVTSFIQRLRTSKDFARRAQALKSDLLARPEIVKLAEGAWDSLRSFLEHDAAERIDDHRPLAPVDAQEEVPRKPDARGGHVGAAGDLEGDDRERDRDAGAAVEHVVEEAVAGVVVVVLVAVEADLLEQEAAQRPRA